MSIDQQSIANVRDEADAPVREKGITTLSLAVFGQKQAGKTSLLASYYGTLQSAGFRKRHRYDITTSRASQGSKLMSTYSRMEKGSFPDATGEDKVYGFDFFPDGMQGNRVDPVLQLKWIDYPGEWWETEARSEEEEAARVQVLRALLMSHAAMLLVDGEKYKEHGERYAKRVFGEFRKEVKRQKRTLYEIEETFDGYPKEWVIALSKSDVFGEGYTAEDFFRSIIEDAADEIEALAEELDSQNFGRLYMLLSAAAKENGAADVNRTKGLEAIAPVALMEAMTGAAGEVLVPKRDFEEYLTRLGYALVKNADKWDDFLAKRYQIITRIIEETKLLEILGSKVTELDRRRDKALKKKNYLEATVFALQGDLRRSEEKHDVFVLQNAK